MSVTAIIGNHNYARYLPQLLKSVEKFCDEVLIYDDASTDESVEVIRSMGHTCVEGAAPASGNQLVGTNILIPQARCTHTLFIDSDNWLVSTPPQLDVDYCAAPLLIHSDDAGGFVDTWKYDFMYPQSWQRSLDRFIDTGGNPYPWGGVWRTGFIQRNNLRWLDWETTQFAADFRTSIEWLKYEPTLDYSPDPFFVFRMHGGQWSESPERFVMEKERDVLRERLRSERT